MKIENFGITLKRLSYENLDDLLIWRNSDDVRLFMDYQKIIEYEDHLKWFESVNNEYNYYFIAYCEDQPFGVYNIKDIKINESEKSAEAGSFLISRKFWGSDLAIRGSFVLLLFAFEYLKLKTLTSKVIKTNEKALYYNKDIGFQIVSNKFYENAYSLALTSDRFWGKNKNLLKYLEKH